MLIEEVAKLSGVSRSTVSRVINNDPNVKEFTRARVKEVIRKVNYRSEFRGAGIGFRADKNYWFGFTDGAVFAVHRSVLSTVNPRHHHGLQRP